MKPAIAEEDEDEDNYSEPGEYGDDREAQVAQPPMMIN